MSAHAITVREYELLALLNAAIAVIDSLSPLATPAATLGEAEWSRIERALDDCGWNQRRAATQLGISAAALNRKLRKSRLRPKDRGQ